MRQSPQSSSATVDLVNEMRACDREPIHIPSAIQPHGVLVALDRQLRIVQVSDNAGTMFGLTVESVLNESLSLLLGPRELEEIAELAEGDAPDGTPYYLPSIELKTTDETLWDAVAHRLHGLLILEFMPSRDALPTSSRRLYQLVKNAMARLRSARTLDELRQATAEEVRRLTGFDRVMIYQFDRHWNGFVAAEDRRGDLVSWLGLHYPASDIPQQARELYRRNWLRLIADVGYKPAPLVPLENPLTGQPLDMSHCVLRSVSPVHIEYLKNMRVGASMSVSILHGDQLWGLIACHHETSYFVPYEVRSACELLGQMFSTHLPGAEDLEHRQYREQIRDVHRQLVAQIAARREFVAGLTEGDVTLLDFFKCGGVGLWRDGAYTLLGKGLAEPEARRLVDWLNAEVEHFVFETDTLHRLLPEAEHWKNVASGLLAIRISRDPDVYLFWFRPEVVQEIAWAGDPDQVHLSEGQDDAPPRLHPRRSFEMWKETVRLTARPWWRWEVEAAIDLRAAIVSEELSKLNLDLRRSNAELDSFAYIASHDLKEPLRGMRAYATFLKEDYAEVLGSDGAERLESLTRLCQRMEDLINSLLHFSRVGRVDLSYRRTDLNEVVANVVETLRHSPQWQDIELRIPRPLPVVKCDAVRIGELFQNLLSNAAKYNDKPQRWTEVGYLTPAEWTAQGNRPDGHSGGLTYYVRDNGIGIRRKHWQSVFDFFKRLHGRSKFGGGTGAGLAIAKTIVERHNGTIWVDSAYGEGTTFYFTLELDEKS